MQELITIPLLFDLLYHSSTGLRLTLHYNIKLYEFELFVLTLSIYIFNLRTFSFYVQNLCFHIRTYTPIIIY